MRPVQGDKKDVRCAFAEDGCPDPTLVSNEHWCFGCKFYVCEDCAYCSLMGDHDVMEHKDEEDE